jgi:hypothetical protein
MNKRKKITKISPQFIKDKNGKATSVLLKYSTYESIINEMTDLKKSLNQPNKKLHKKKK